MVEGLWQWSRRYKDRASASAILLAKLMLALISFSTAVLLELHRLSLYLCLAIHRAIQRQFRSIGCLHPCPPGFFGFPCLTSLRF